MINSKSLIIISIIVFLIIGIITTTSEAIITSEPAIELTGVFIEYVESKDKTFIREQIEECKIIMNHAHEMAESARNLGYKEEHPVIVLAKKEWVNAKTNLTNYENQLEKIKTAEINKYPEAAKVWYYLKNLGYNDYICAGIIGNLMSETGGNTLNLNPNLTTKNYYGICQWNKSYLKIWYKDLDSQCEYLKNTIKYEIDTYGDFYKKDFNYNDFLNIKDEREAALIFAKCYERCSSRSHSKRQDNATKALKYFS